jgi:ABC-2 type transport system permease protein
MTWFFEMEIFDSITSGGIAYELARPVDLYGRWFCQTAANRLSKTALRCLPILTVAFMVPEPFRMSLPANGVQFTLFLLSAALSLCVVVSFSMLVYVSAFYTLSAMGTRFIAAALADFMAGSIVPLPFFPQPFRAVAELLPFAAMQNTPLRVYSGHIAGGGAVWSIGLQIFWLIAFVLTGRLAMNKALRKVVVQGG